MKSKCESVALLGFLAVYPLLAQGVPKSKSITLEVRRFTLAEGVNFPKEFPDFLYALLIEKLTEAPIGAVVLGENELADPPGADTLVLEGKVLASKGAWYRGAGEKQIVTRVVFRRGADEILFQKEVTAGPSVWTRVSYEDENELWSAAALADRIIKEVRAALKR